MKNQIKFQYVGGQMREVLTIDLNDMKMKPFNFKELSENIKIEIIDIRELKRTWNKLKKDWFPIGQKNTTLAVGILWTAFVTYIFPWLLDIAKVYCAFQIAQGFYKENRGIQNKDGRSGFQSFIYYGKWLVAFHLIPIGVELLDQIGAKMMIDIKTDPLVK